jgi:integrase/recombinase XerD
MEYLDMKQVTDIMRAAYKKSTRDHLILLLSFQHGLRRSEVAKLTLADIANGRIKVQRVKRSLETDQPLMPSDNVLFNEPLALQTWLRERPEGGEALFPSRKGKMALEAKSVGFIAVQYMELAKVPEDLAHHHSLKHALASLMIRSGKGLELVKQALGHRAISSTIHYVHTLDSEATAAAQDAIAQALKQ